MTGSTKLASAAVALMLALPAVALAQPAPSPSGAAAPAPSTAPATSNEAPPSTAMAPSSQTPRVTGAERRVTQHIKELHAQLQITPAEEPQWRQFADVMRENAKNMDQAFTLRARQYSAMNAVQNMQSYAKIADDHAQRVQKLVPAFETLYNAMPEQQKQLTDQVFRANAEAHARKRVESGRNEAH